MCKGNGEVDPAYPPPLHCSATCALCTNFSPFSGPKRKSSIIPSTPQLHSQFRSPSNSPYNASKPAASLIGPPVALGTKIPKAMARRWESKALGPCELPAIAACSADPLPGKLAALESPALGPPKLRTSPRQLICPLWHPELLF